jgi:hypothetical protein
MCHPALVTRRGCRCDPLDLRPMDPRDDLDSLAGGVDCAACGQVVPTERVRVLARRDDIAFVEIHCPLCRSESLGIVIATEAAGDGPAGDPDRGGMAVGPGRTYGEFLPGDVERFREALPIDRADLDLVHELLARGGIAALVGRGDPPAAGSGR